MSAAVVEVQALLRFLTQDAKLPLTLAMGKMREMQKASLTSPSLLAGSNLHAIQAIFPDEKIAKQILNAAKRISKKRGSSESQSGSPNKRKKVFSPEELVTPAAIEESLALPSACANEEQLRKITLRTNRAPLVLAFAVVLLKYTMPEQPLSSRLSLAQAVVSVNSRSKAVSIGLEKGNSAEEDGWGRGQPQVRIMGRDIRVMKRWGYDWREKPRPESDEGQVPDSQETIKAEDSTPLSNENNTIIKDPPGAEAPPPLWGLDLEALRSANAKQTHGPQTPHKSIAPTPGLPIYTAESARAYLLKSFSSLPPPPPPSSDPKSPPPSKKKKPSSPPSETERNLALLLTALDLLFSSWAQSLSRHELDRRAWAWYVSVRPDVRQGVSGWGEKGELRISGIVDLCK